MTPPQLKSGLYVLGVAGLAMAVLSVEAPSRSDLPSPMTVAIVIGLQVFSLVAAGEQWVTLIGAHGKERSDARRVLYLSQLAKYLPAGGFLQAASQISASESGGSTVRTRATKFGIGVVQLIGSAGLVGSLLLLESGWRVGLGLGSLLLGVAVTIPRLAEWISTQAMRRLAGEVPEFPTRVELGTAQVWSVLNIGSLALAFGVLQTEVSVALAVAAFALAWLAGFLVAPIPAGLGIREAALAAILVGAHLPPLLLAAVLLRIFGLAAELLLVGASQIAGVLHRDPINA